MLRPPCSMGLCGPGCGAQAVAKGWMSQEQCPHPCPAALAGARWAACSCWVGSPAFPGTIHRRVQAAACPTLPRVVGSSQCAPAPALHGCSCSLPWSALAQQQTSGWGSAAGIRSGSPCLGLCGDLGVTASAWLHDESPDPFSASSFQLCRSAQTAPGVMEPGWLPGAALVPVWVARTGGEHVVGGISGAGPVIAVWLGPCRV